MSMLGTEPPVGRCLATETLRVCGVLLHDESSDTRPCRCAALSSASRVQRRGAERVVAVPTFGADADHCWTDRRGVRLVSAPAARGMVAPSRRVNRTRGGPGFRRAA